MHTYLGARRRTSVSTSEQEAYQDITMAVDSELPVVMKAYFYLSATSTATAASVSLDVSYSDGGAEEGFGLVDFRALSADEGGFGPTSWGFGGDDGGFGLGGFGAEEGDEVSGTWTQGIADIYPTRVISSAKVRDKWWGVGRG